MSRQERPWSHVLHSMAARCPSKAMVSLGCNMLRPGRRILQSKLAHCMRMKMNKAVRVGVVALVLVCLYNVFQVTTWLGAWAEGRGFSLQDRTQEFDKRIVVPMCVPSHVQEKFKASYPGVDLSQAGNPFLGEKDMERFRYQNQDIRRHRKAWIYTMEQLPYKIRTVSDSMNMRSLLQLLKHPLSVDKLASAQCRRCVVVGNGNVLKDSGLGSCIDSYDIVIRMNDAPLRGFSRDVGNRTSLRLCYPESLPDTSAEHDRSSFLVFLPFKSRDLQWLLAVLRKQPVSTHGFWKTPPKATSFASDHMNIINPDLIKVAGQHFVGISPENLISAPLTPTTGIIAITIGLRLCDELHIAGFGYNASSPDNPVHYYGNDTMSFMNKSTTHNITAEAAFIHKLVEDRVILDLTRRSNNHDTRKNELCKTT
ncbi:type 2 lactosamine alpha-2,3-sialyltransferase-like isoform X1 [Lethenteron reissneri]|uniref:type 2 lactosamine alpha-2,3-sialyltransferase-like isoform X1 n=2 Tax=Lethenteron reissneri TaxID=7753 RepID=UPI002AB7DB22|nr:type 2 lactosamine alpha-2,3-sialyltransferase-like isoform X1 [Lethenteron reissneri]